MENYVPALYATVFSLLPPLVAIALALITKEVSIVDGGASQSISRTGRDVSGSGADSFGREECIHLNNLCGIERGELEESVYFRHPICNISPYLFILFYDRIIRVYMEISIVDGRNTIE